MAHRQVTQNMVEAEMLGAKFRMFGDSLEARHYTTRRGQPAPLSQATTQILDCMHFCGRWLKTADDFRMRSVFFSEKPQRRSVPTEGSWQCHSPGPFYRSIDLLATATRSTGSQQQE
jgi:hypothetical protein